MAPPSPDEVETQANGAATNGVGQNGDSKYIDSVDQDDPEFIKEMQRPPDIKEDLQAMEARQRVSVILNSQAFREELEAIVESQIRNSSHPASLIALQHIAEMVLPPSGGKAFKKGSVAAALGPGLQTTIPLAAAAAMIPPVNDLRGSDFMAYSKVEKYLRCKLASLYRIVDLFGWSHGIYNHITLRSGSEADHFLINPFGMLYSEITASSLVKVDTLGAVIDEGSTTMGINKAGYTIHSALHSFRPDIKCIIHLHTPAAVAVSACKQGLMAISQEAMIVGDVSYHDYHGIALTDEEKDALQKSIGPYNKVVFLRNHGILACGGTIEEAWHFAFNTMKACETQVKLIPLGLDNVIEASPKAREQVKEVTSHGGGGVDSSGKKWKIGELEFEALMRLLDNAGYQTGYIYKQPISYDIKGSRAGSEVEIPPSATNIPNYGPDSELSPSKQMALLKQKKFKDSWLNSPNAYSKVELEETGTNQPKKYTTWVKGSPTHINTTVRVENANAFAPLGEDPKELKKAHTQIKKNWYEDNISSGPQSKILEGMTWEEAEKLKESLIKGGAAPGSHEVIMMGAASKGIIKREQQHNATVYKTYYQANPFANVDENEDMEAYQKQVESNKLQEQDGTEIVEVTTVVAGPPPDLEVSSSPAAQPSSPAKSLTSTHSDAELDQTPSSPSKGDASASSGDKDKKKKKFRAPSFLKTKKKSGKSKGDKEGCETPSDEKKDKEKSAAQQQ